MLPFKVVTPGNSLADAAPEPWVRVYRRSATALVFAAAFVSGLAENTLGAARFLGVLAFASAVTLWCGLDAKLHGKVFVRSFAWLMMFTWPVGVLAHLVWTRRVRGVPQYFGAAVVALALFGAGLAMHAVIANR